MTAMASMKDKEYDLAICDPQYGLAGGLQDISDSYRKRNKRREEHDTKYTKGVSKLSGAGKLKNRILNQDKCEWDKEPPPPEYFTELMRVTKNQLIWGGNYFYLPPTRGFCIWDKEQPWPNFSACEFAWSSFDVPSKIFRLCTFRTKETKIHPTQKPVALYQWLLKNYAKPGDRILDTHLGSGSSAIAADIMGYNFTGYEIDEDYYKAALDRFNRHKQQCVLEFA
jgi:site-specific DNA-methyltransferase (adenine-specific)